MIFVKLANTFRSLDLLVKLIVLFIEKNSKPNEDIVFNNII